MDAFLAYLMRGVEQLIARADGPLHFRLVVMPLVVTFLALRAHRRDVREGRPTRLGAFFTDPTARTRLFRSALKDIGRVFLMAIAMDTAYQLWVYRWVYPVQLLIVAVACAIVPYVLVRGPIMRLARRFMRG